MLALQPTTETISFADQLRRIKLIAITVIGILLIWVVLPLQGGIRFSSVRLNPRCTLWCVSVCVQLRCALKVERDVVLRA